MMSQVYTKSLHDLFLEVLGLAVLTACWLTLQWTTSARDCQGHHQKHRQASGEMEEKLLGTRGNWFLSGIDLGSIHKNE